MMDCKINQLEEDIARKMYGYWFGRKEAIVAL
jgi:hypothetical protein